MKPTTPGTPGAGTPRSRTARRRAAPARAVALSVGLMLVAGAAAGPAAATTRRPAAATTRRPAAATRRPAEIGNRVLVRTATVHKYGKVLVNQKGLVLYYNTRDTPSHWACTGTCLLVWPPLTLPPGEALAQLSNGISGLGTVPSAAGAQVTWDGKPLYTFKHDTGGTVKGEGVAHIWFVVQLSHTLAGAAWP